MRWLAMENDDTFSAKLLIDAGADVKPDDMYEVRSPGMLRLLLAAGLKINSHNELGETPLYCNRGNEVLQLAPKCVEELDGLRRRIDELEKKA